MPYPHIHFFYALLAVLFALVLSYLVFYNKRSRDRQKTIEHGTPHASKEAGILDAQESIKREHRQHHK